MATPQLRRALAAKWIDLLRDGTDCNWHGAVLGVATAMSRAGWSDFEFYAEMQKDSNRLARQFRRKQERGQLTTREHTAENSYPRRLAETWSKAEAKVLATPTIRNSADASQHLGLIRAAIATYPWKGRTARVDRELITLLVDIAHERGTASPSVSLRSLWEQSTIQALRTVWVSLRRLADAGWLTIEKDGDPAHPQIYRLQVPELATALLGSPPRVDTAVASSGTHPQTHVLLALAFTRTAAAIYVGLTCDEPQIKAALARTAGVSRDSLDMWLPKLAGHGLAQQVEGGWIRGDADPEVAAFDAGANVYATRREGWIKEKRAAWEQWHADRDTAVKRSREAERQARRRTVDRQRREDAVVEDRPVVTDADAVVWPADEELARQDPGGEPVSRPRFRRVTRKELNAVEEAARRRRETGETDGTTSGRD